MIKFFLEECLGDLILLGSSILGAFIFLWGGSFLHNFFSINSWASFPTVLTTFVGVIACIVLVIVAFVRLIAEYDNKYKGWRINEDRESGNRTT